MKTRDVLRAAVRLLKRDGWVQGYWCAPTGCRCATGAVYAVNADKRCTQRAISRLAHRLPNASSGATDEARVIHWNDAVGRTKEQVLARFRRYT